MIDVVPTNPFPTEHIPIFLSCRAFCMILPCIHAYILPQQVYATATEDMDALTFRTPKLLRKFTSSQGKDKQPIIEVDYEKMLEGLGLTYEQFVDLCILCGCDYCSTIRGIGSKVRVYLMYFYTIDHGTPHNNTSSIHDCCLIRRL